MPGARPLVVVVSFALLLAASACKQDREAWLTLAGSTSVQPFAEKWAEVYRASHPGGEIHVQGGGSTAGVQAALSGAAHIGMCSRPLKPNEAAKLKSVVVARDAIAVVVHPQSEVSGLTLHQVQALYSGEAASWKAVGGREVSVTVITREEGSGTRGAFEELVMNGKEIAGSALVQDSTGAVRQMVSQDPGAVGYISLGQVDSSVRALKLGGVEPSEREVDAGRYPVVRPFLFLLAGEPTQQARSFIDWVTGPDGQALSRQQGRLPPAP